MSSNNSWIAHAKAYQAAHFGMTFQTALKESAKTYTKKKESKSHPLSKKEREKLPEDTFCGSNRSYPVPDKNHAVIAIAYAKKYSSQGKLSKAEGRRILECVHEKYPELHISPSPITPKFKTDNKK